MRVQGDCAGAGAGVGFSGGVPAAPLKSRQLSLKCCFESLKPSCQDRFSSGIAHGHSWMASEHGLFVCCKLPSCLESCIRGVQRGVQGGIFKGNQCLLRAWVQAGARLDVRGSSSAAGSPSRPTDATFNSQRTALPSPFSLLCQYIRNLELSKDKARLDEVRPLPTRDWSLGA